MGKGPWKQGRSIRLESHCDVVRFVMRRGPPFASCCFALKCAPDTELLVGNHRKMMAAGLEQDPLRATQAEHHATLELKDLSGSLLMGATRCWPGCPLDLVRESGPAIIAGERGGQQGHFRFALVWSSLSRAEHAPQQSLSICLSICLSVCLSILLSSKNSCIDRLFEAARLAFDARSDTDLAFLFNNSARDTKMDARKDA